MYEFADTLAQTVAINRPAEAMRINGVYLEDEISGYQTTSVSGRETLEASVESQENPTASGSLFLSRRYPSRTITVRYAIAAKTNREFREAYNNLNRILDQEEARFIFDDEPDKYFVGTKTGGEEPQPGRNSVTGSFEIFCSDPLKYSVTEKAVPLDYDGKGKEIWSFTAENEGSQSVSARYELKVKSENGYLALNPVPADGQKILCFGSVLEVDEQAETTSVDLLDFTSLKTAAKDSVSCHDFKVMKSEQREGAGEREWIALDTQSGSCAAGSDGWCLSQVTVDLPEYEALDESGQVIRSNAVRDFYCKSYHWFETGANGQTGEQVLQFLDRSGAEICAFGITKGDREGNTAKAYFRCGGVLKWLGTFTANASNPYGSSAQREGHNMVSKEGALFKYFWMGTVFSYRDPELENAQVRSIRLVMQHSKPLDKGRYVTRNYIGDDFRFEGRNIRRSVNLPNTFSAGASLSINGEDGTFRLNGMFRPDLEVLGSRYFKIKPGSVKVNVTPSSWISGADAMEGTMFFREAWL